MKNAMNNFKMYSVYLGILFMSLSLSSCSDDDDGVIDDIFTGSITALDQTVEDNTIMVQSLTVGQDSWLVAVHSDEADSDNFIAGPLWIDEGIASEISLMLDENADLEENGDEITLKLYADDDDEVWDADDEPVTDENGVLATETITVVMEGSFSSFDENNDGMLDENEVPNTYVNNFDAWDTDDDDFLSEEEFYDAVFYNTDADDDDMIDEDEWNVGYASMYGTYVDDDFATYDVDNDGFLEVTEWNDVFVNSGWFDTYDADDDAFVTLAEWDTGLYNDWDLDNDGFVDEDEYNLYYDYTTWW